MQQLERVLENTRLTTTQLYDLGRGIAFVEADPTAALPLFAAAVRQGVASFSSATHDSLTTTQQDEVQALRMVIRPLWEAKQYETTLPLFELLSRLEEPGSFAAFRVRYLLAECFYEMARPTKDPQLYERAEAVLQAMRDDTTLQLDPPARGEVEWAYGSVLYSQDRYADAVEHLAAAAEVKGQYYTDPARIHHIWALWGAGRRDEAAVALEAPGTSASAKAAVVAGIPDLQKKEPS